jgi:hypothetical protein
MKFYGSKKVVAQFVNDLLNTSDVDWPSITIMKLEKLEAYSVSIVTNSSSEDTVERLARIYSVALLSTSHPAILDG